MTDEVFTLRINPNYTISIIDLNQKELNFRDITGRDLEVLDHIIESIEQTEKGLVADVTQVVQILNLLSIEKIDFSLFPKRIIFLIFTHIQKNILLNYIKKVEWLKICYEIQNKSFVNVLEMEKVPMSKFITMYQIYKELAQEKKIEPGLE